MRLILAVALTLVAGALGALVLGEYEIAGLVGLGAGLVFGLLMGEVALGVARARSQLLAVAVASVAAVAMVWALWISTGSRLSDVAVDGWAAVGLASGVAWVRVRPTRRGPSTPPAKAR